GVAAHDHLDGLGVEIAHLVLGYLPRLGPGAVRVRVIALVRDAINTDGVERAQAVGVVEEAAVDVAAEELAGWLLHLLGHATPRPVLLPHDVGPLEDIRDPPDLAFGVGDR